MKRLLLGAGLVYLARKAIEPDVRRFQLASDSFTPGGTIAQAQAFNDWGCTGGNRSPHLRWSDPPAGTKSLAVTCFDPDAPTGSGWWHWVAFNLPADLRELPENASASGLPGGAVQSRTDYNRPGYNGPCPPEGDPPHRYVFTVWALAGRLPLDADATGAMVGFNLRQQAVGKAVTTGRYGR
jgi:Raf kinase inhibitor-like YbhB/YbcL family protein